MKLLVIACIAAALGLSTGAVQAQQTKKAPAKSSAKAATKKTTTAKKRVPAKTAKAVEAHTPVESLSQRLTPAELAIAQTIHTGTISCELGANVTVTPDEKNLGFFRISSGKQSDYMHPVESRTGAIRLEDNRAGALWLQLGNKSMLMNQRLGQRIADECAAPQQREFAARMKDQPQVDLLGGSK